MPLSPNWAKFVMDVRNVSNLANLWWVGGRLNSSVLAEVDKWAMWDGNTVLVFRENCSSDKWWF